MLSQSILYMISCKDTRELKFCRDKNGLPQIRYQTNVTVSLSFLPLIFFLSSFFISKMREVWFRAGTIEQLVIRLTYELYPGIVSFISDFAFFSLVFSLFFENSRFQMYLIFFVTFHTSQYAYLLFFLSLSLYPSLFFVDITDVQYQKTMLLTYRAFMTPHKLLDMIIARYFPHTIFSILMIYYLLFIGVHM
jgi:hypothetical protein